MPIGIHWDTFLPVVRLPQLTIRLGTVVLHVLTECFLGKRGDEPPRLNLVLGGVPGSPRVKPAYLPRHPHPQPERIPLCIPILGCQFPPSAHPDSESSHSTPPYTWR